jgi:hypothetical protein
VNMYGYDLIVSEKVTDSFLASFPHMLCVGCLALISIVAVLKHNFFFLFHLEDQSKVSLPKSQCFKTSVK